MVFFFFMKRYSILMSTVWTLDHETRTSQCPALTISDLPVKVVHGYLDVGLALGDGALEVLLDF